MVAAEQDRAGAQDERNRAVERAERSEAREILHQDRWANEIHALRESVEQLKAERTQRQRLEDHVLRLQRELQTLRQRLARYELPADRLDAKRTPD
jgi:molecular chaperone GrpE (heat shock protein)